MSLPINHLKRTLDRCCGAWEFRYFDDAHRYEVEFLNTHAYYVIFFSDGVWDANTENDEGAEWLTNRLNGLTRDDSGNVAQSDVCECECHHDASALHVFPCCGPGSQNPELKPPQCDLKYDFDCVPGSDEPANDGWTNQGGFQTYDADEFVKKAVTPTKHRPFASAEERIEQLTKALKQCVNALEKGIEVRMMDQWPALVPIVPDTIAMAKKVLGGVSE